MNKILSSMVIAFILTGCASMNSIIDNNRETEPDIDMSTIPSGIFTYYDDPAQYHLPVEYFLIGKFVTQNDCLLFEHNNELYTPVLPAKYTKYTIGDTQITVGNEAYNIGETGDISAHPIKREYIRDFITKGPSQCLLDQFMKIKVRGLRF